MILKKSGKLKPLDVKIVREMSGRFLSKKENFNASIWLGKKTGEVLWAVVRQN